MYAELVRRAEQIVQDEIRNGEAHDCVNKAEWDDRVIRMVRWLQKQDRKIAHQL